MLADGYATALNVLGPEHGAALAEKLNLAVQFIIREPDGTFSTRSTPAFERRTKSSQVQDR
jgi:thiamine biosynthesis lipoprotein